MSFKYQSFHRSPKKLALVLSVILALSLSKDVFAASTYHTTNFAGTFNSGNANVQAPFDTVCTQGGPFSGSFVYCDQLVPAAGSGTINVAVSSYPDIGFIPSTTAFHCHLGTGLDFYYAGLSGTLIQYNNGVFAGIVYSQNFNFSGSQWQIQMGGSNFLIYKTDGSGNVPPLSSPYVSGFFNSNSLTGQAVYNVPFPTVTTVSATSITTSSAVLRGSVNATGNSGLPVTFDYGTTLPYDNTGITSDQGTASGSTTSSFSVTITGLNSNTLYHFRCNASSADLTSTVNGADVTFMTSATGIPIANAQTVNVAHGTAKGITLTGSDPASLPIIFSTPSAPAHGGLSAFNPNTGAVTYTPNSTYQGTDSFTFTVSNGTTTSSAATVTLNVAPGTPTANAQTVAVNFNTAKGVTLTGTDLDNPALSLTYATVTAPTHGSLSGLNASTGAVNFTPTTGYHGADSFTFTVSNGTNTSAAATVTLNVATGTPTATAQSKTTAFNTAIGLTLVGTDPDVPALTLTFNTTSNPAHGALSGFNASTGAVTYTPTTNYSGTDSFTFTVSNGTNTSSTATVSLTDTPGTPTATPQSQNVTFNTGKALTLRQAPILIIRL